jgi:hypothetical protein
VPSFSLSCADLIRASMAPFALMSTWIAGVKPGDDS